MHQADVLPFLVLFCTLENFLHVLPSTMCIFPCCFQCPCLFIVKRGAFCVDLPAAQRTVFAACLVLNHPKCEHASKLVFYF